MLTQYQSLIDITILMLTTSSIDIIIDPVDAYM